MRLLELAHIVCASLGPIELRAPFPVAKSTNGEARPEQALVLTDLEDVDVGQRLVVTIVRGVLATARTVRAVLEPLEGRPAVVAFVAHGMLRTVGMTEEGNRPIEDAILVGADGRSLVDPAVARLLQGKVITLLNCESPAVLDTIAPQPWGQAGPSPHAAILFANEFTQASQLLLSGFDFFDRSAFADATFGSLLRWLDDGEIPLDELPDRSATLVKTHVRVPVAAFAATGMRIAPSGSRLTANAYFAS